MLFKILVITFSIVGHCPFLQAQENIQANATIIKEDLGDLYAVAFNNKWKTITERMENILNNYENNNDNEETLKQLTVLKGFVLTSKLNPVRTQAFLESYETIVGHLKIINEVKVASLPIVETKPIQGVPVKITPVTKTEKNLFKNWMWFAVGGIVGGGFLFIFKNKKSLRRGTELDFEQNLERESDLKCWGDIRTEIYRLIFDSKTLMKESAGCFVMDDLFSLEFYLLGSTLPVESITRLKNILSEHQGELLLVNDYQAEGKIQTRKLVLNFPV